jgi:hypothetical protein
MADETTRPATHADAELILKLYELRREPVMRAARHFITAVFWPKSADEILEIIRAFGTERNEWLRQVIGYWEMVSSFVNRGVLERELFLDYAGELFFTYAKFRPFLAELRAAVSPGFLGQTEKLLTSCERAQQMVEVSAKRLAARTQAQAAMKS